MDTSYLYNYKVVIRSTYDGDSFRANVSMGFGQTNEGLDGKGLRFRLYGADTPELRGFHKEAGLLVRDYVRGLIPDGSSRLLRSIELGLYGRYIAKIYFPLEGKEVSLHEHLLEKKFAKPVGINGNRATWSKEELDYIINTLS